MDTDDAIGRGPATERAENRGHISVSDADAVQLMISSCQRSAINSVSLLSYFLPAYISTVCHVHLRSPGGARVPR